MVGVIVGIRDGTWTIHHCYCTAVQQLLLKLGTELRWYDTVIIRYVLHLSAY